MGFGTNFYISGPNEEKLVMHRYALLCFLLLKGDFFLNSYALTNTGKCYSRALVKFYFYHRSRLEVNATFFMNAYSFFSVWDFFHEHSRFAGQ